MRSIIASRPFLAPFPNESYPLCLPRAVGLAPRGQSTNMRALHMNMFRYSPNWVIVDHTTRELSETTLPGAT